MPGVSSFRASSTYIHNLLKLESQERNYPHTGSVTRSAVLGRASLPDRVYPGQADMRSRRQDMVLLNGYCLSRRRHEFKSRWGSSFYTNFPKSNPSNNNSNGTERNRPAKAKLTKSVYLDLKMAEVRLKTPIQVFAKNAECRRLSSPIH